jgi:hypothetical protein
VEKIVLIPIYALIRRASLVALITAMGLLTACSPDTEQSGGKPPVTETAETAKTEAVETAATDEQVNASRITREG